MGTSGNQEPSDTTRLQATEPSGQVGRKNDIYLARRANVMRTLVVPVLLGIVLVVLLLVGREWLIKREFADGMKRLGEQIDTFVQTHGRFPSPEQVKKFDLKSRSLGEDRVSYPDTAIPQEPPPRMLLAHSPELDLKILSGGYVVLYVDGGTAWVDAQRLEELLRERNQLFSRSIMP